MAITQLSVFLGSDRTNLLRMAEALSEAGVSILALSVTFESTYGIARILVDAPDRAREVLGQAGLTVNAVDVIPVCVPNRRGVLASISRVLDEAEIPIEYLYGTLAPAASEVVIVIRTSRIPEALEALGAAGIQVLMPMDLSR